jgi:hypothetical protein
MDLAINFYGKNTPEYFDCNNYRAVTPPGVPLDPLPSSALKLGGWLMWRKHQQAQG